MMFWFHATRRREALEYLAVVETGVRPPKITTDTQQLELALGVEEPHVYCYLGRTLEQFGDFCVVLKPKSLPAGQMCPFDSGGLVRKIPPVSTWEEKKRVEYLDAFSFLTTTTIGHPCIRYPGDGIRSYLLCERPPYSGPHELWEKTPKADIWTQGTHWRAWTWEGRWRELPVDGNVHAWSCSPALFARILEASEQDTAIAPAMLDRFIGLYREGGVSALIADLRIEQGG